MNSTSETQGPLLDDQIRDYFRILKENPKSRVFAPLSQALLKKGDRTKAEEVCKVGLAQNPDFSDGYLALARILAANFRHQEALVQLENCLQRNPADINAWIFQIEIQLQMGKSTEASHSCKRALDIDPHHPELQKVLKEMALESRQKHPDAAREVKSQSSLGENPGTLPGVQNRKRKASKDLFDPILKRLRSTGPGEKVVPPSSANKPENIEARKPDVPKHGLLNDSDSDSVVSYIQSVIDRFGSEDKSHELPLPSTFGTYHSEKIKMLMVLVIVMGGIVGLVWFVVR